MHNQGVSKMVSAISNVTQTQPLAQFTGTSTQKPTQSGPPSATSTDSVQLSKTAQALVSVLQEARETQAQTAKEAGYGDLQAQRLLAKEAAAKSVAK
jgi:hypothetical protein